MDDDKNILEQPLGYRARVGYVSVAFVTEVLPMAFYRMAPAGISLAFLTLQREGGRDGNPAELGRLYDQTLDAARSLARSGVDMVVLGGRPVTLAHGMENAGNFLAELEAEFGLPVTSDATAQEAAYRALGSKKIATAHPFANEENKRHEAMIAELGFTPAGALGFGSTRVDLPKLSPGDALELGRATLKAHPEADTLLFPCPHWAVVDAISPIEAEFGVNVVTNLQATLWEVLQRLGLCDPVPGFGRLLAGPLPLAAAPQSANQSSP